MRKSDKVKKVFGLILILAIVVSVFGGVVSAVDLSGGLTQSVYDAEIQTPVGNLSSEELTKALDDDPLHQVGSVYASSSNLGDQAASLAEAVVGAPYLLGAKGWNWNPSGGWLWSGGKFVDSDGSYPSIKGGYYYYKSGAPNDVAFGKGLDCSGLSFWTYNKAAGANKLIDASNPIYEEGASGQWTDNERLEQISKGDLKRGDLLFLIKGGGAKHVIMYVGNGYVVHAEGVIFNEIKKEELSTVEARYTNYGYTIGYGRVKAASGDKFNIGDIVRVTTNLNVRTGPGTGYSEITDPDYPGYAPAGTIGTVLSGPSSADSFIWWEIDYGPGLYSGWSVEGGLEKVEDNILPTVDAFSVTPASVTLGDTFTIPYTVSDTGGSGLKQVELWRKGTGDWEQIGDPISLLGEGDGPYSNSFYDAPTSVGTYEYGMHVADNAGNLGLEPDPPGPIVVEVTPVNQPPTLSNGYVTPASGDTSTTFDYYVTYTDSDGDAPTTKYVYVDGSPHTMTKVSGSYTSGATFKYSTTLSAGSHNYYFYFDDGHSHAKRLPTSGTYSGPTVCGNMGVNPTSWSPTIFCGNSNSQTATVSASGGIVKGVTVGKISGPTWLSVSPANLGDIASGSSKTFTITASPPSETSGDFPYTVRVSNTCGTPSTRDVSGTIHVSCPCGNMGVNPTSWSPTINCVESDSKIVTVSATGGTVKGVTVGKISGPTWLSVSPTNLGDISSGSSKTFTITASPPSETSGDFGYTVRVSNTCGTPSTRDVSGTIHVSCPCGNMGVNPTSWSPTIEHGHSDSRIVTVSASSGPVKGVTVSKISGPTWLSVSPTNLGDIASGSSKTFTMTASPPAGTSGDFAYTVRVSNTCGSPSSRDVTGTIHVAIPCGNMGVNPTTWRPPTINCGESDSQIVTVSATGGTVEGVTVSKISGETWLTLSQTNLGDIPSGSSETFTVTAAPPAGTSSGDYPYAVRVSNTCGTPSSRDVTGTIPVECPSCGNMGVNPTSWSTTIFCGNSDNEIVTVSASDGVVEGVTVSKESGPTWLSVSPTDLGDIASGSSKTFTITAAPPSGTSGDFTYTVRVSNTCGSPSTRDVSGTITVTITTIDTTPPSAVTDLATTDPTSNSIKLTWTAPGDDGNTGTATTYDIRYLEGTPITESNWASANQSTGEPSPNPAGSAEAFVVTGLSPDTIYYFALKTADEVPNWSPISNSPNGKTKGAAIAATRDISPQQVMNGSTFTVTVTIIANQDIYAPILDEGPPTGWSVTSVQNDGATFKESEIKWLWTESLSKGDSRTVIYNVTVPSDTEPKDYMLTGNVSAYGVEPITVGGDNTITVITDWNPWDDDGIITDSEIQEAVYCWLTDTPKNDHLIMDSEIQELVYMWLTG